MTAFDDSGSRSRHPSVTSLNPGTPADPRLGGAGPAVPAPLPRRAGPATLHRQRRHIFYGASIVTLLLVIVAAFAPTLAGWVGGLLLAAGLWAALTFVLWVGAFEAGHWWARRRARRFDAHTVQALRVVR